MEYVPHISRLAIVWSQRERLGRAVNRRAARHAKGLVALGRSLAEISKTHPFGVFVEEDLIKYC